MKIPASTQRAKVDARRGSTDKLLYLIKTRGPQTAPALAEVLDMTSMGARKLLQGLQQQDLVSHYYDDHAPGKPKQYWILTEAGQARFPDRHSDLTLELIEQVRGALGEKALDKIITRREQDQTERYLEVIGAAKTLRGRLARLVRLRTREGYMAEFSRLDDGSYLLVENHCPICAAASVCQGLCRSELEIFRKVLAAQVERVEYILDGSRRCAYKVAG